MIHTAPISIPSSSSSSSASRHNHQRYGSDKGSDLSSGLVLASLPSYSWSNKSIDTYQATRLAHSIGSFTAKDILSVEEASHSRLVVIPESDSIEAAGAKWTKDHDKETWLLLKADRGSSQPTDTKLKKSECVGLLGLEDLASFLAIFFGQQYTKVPESGQADITGLASPPPSPLSTSAKVSPYQREPYRASWESMKAKITSNQPIASRFVSNLSECNALQHVSLDTDLNSILVLLSQSNFRCLVVFDRESDHSDDGAVCGIITALDVVSFLMTQAEHDKDLAALFSTSLDDEVTSTSHDQVAVISGEKSVLDALTRMRSDDLTVLAIMDPVGGFLSPISSQEIAVEILRSSTRKILTTPLASFVKKLRSRDPQGTDGKDTHPAIRIGMSSSMGRAASLLLATASKGVFVLDEPRVVMTPPLSCVSISPSRELSMEAEIIPVSKIVPQQSSPAQKQRRYSTQYWTTPRSYSGTTTNDASLPPLPSFSGAGEQLERRSSLKLDRNSNVSVQTTKTPAAAVPGLFRSPSGTQAHRPRSQSFVQSGAEDACNFRQYAQQSTFRSQTARTPSNQAPGASSGTACSPSSPYGNVFVSGSFGDASQNGMPRHLITLQTILRSVLAVTKVDSFEN